MQEKQSLGGTGSLKPATPKVQEICNKVRPQLQKTEGKNFAKFKAVHYKTQTVAGTNYYIKVETGTNQYVHLKLFEDLQKIVHIITFEKGKTKDEPLATI